MRINSNRLSIALISLGSALIIIAVVLMVLVATDVIDDGVNGRSDLETITVFGEPISSPTPGPSPTPGADWPPGSGAPIARLVIPAAEIDARVLALGLDENNVMEVPDNAYDVAWYDFTGRPGSSELGNAVFSGHVDWYSVGEAVFWNLKDLNENDEIQIHLQDGTVYRYTVRSKRQYAVDEAPIDDIIGPTAKQSVTLITCSGTFNNSTHQYDKRLIIRAERIA